MIFNWLELVPLAYYVLGKRAKRFSLEARQRCAISRVYYAILIAARNYLRDKDKVTIPTDGSLHTFVINRFFRSRNKNRREIGQILWELRTLRNMADYEDQIVDLTQKTQLALDLANKAVTRLNRL